MRVTFTSTVNRKNLLFSIVVCLFIAVLVILPTGFEDPSWGADAIREKARVIEVNDDDLQKNGLIIVGEQFLKLEILSGKFKGEIVQSRNLLMGQMKIDQVYQKGDKVLAVLKVDGAHHQVISARADGLYRLGVEWWLFGLFALFLVGFARWTGFKALVSFVFTALVMWKVMLPLFLHDFPPLVVAFFVVSLTTTVIVLLITGFTRKGAVALIGAIGGIGITTCLALVFGMFFRIPGSVQEFSETLLYAGYTHLKLSDIFLSGIFISAAGAVMDVAMDIAAAQNEIIEQKPEISRTQLVRSGFNVAYPVIGTMTTTLLFAYSGSFTFVFMVFMAKGTAMANIFNTNYIAAEVLQTLVGSFGLVLVAPITAIVGGYHYSRK